MCLELSLGGGGGGGGQGWEELSEPPNLHTSIYIFLALPSGIIEHSYIAYTGHLLIAFQLCE